MYLATYSNTVCVRTWLIWMNIKQHEFSTRHSCETQLTTVINNRVKILDNGGQVDILRKNLTPRRMGQDNFFSSKTGTPNNDFMALALSLCWRDQRAVIMRG